MFLLEDIIIRFLVAIRHSLVEVLILTMLLTDFLVVVRTAPSPPVLITVLLPEEIIMTLPGRVMTTSLAEVTATRSLEAVE